MEGQTRRWRLPARDTIGLPVATGTGRSSWLFDVRLRRAIPNVMAHHLHRRRLRGSRPDRGRQRQHDLRRGQLLPDQCRVASRNQWHQEHPGIRHVNRWDTLDRETRLQEQLWDYEWSHCGCFAFRRPTGIFRPKN